MPLTQRPDRGTSTHSTPTGPQRWSNRLAVLAGIWSALAVAIGTWWWATGTYPFGPADPQGEDTALGALPAAAGPPLLIGAGTLGVLVALVAAAQLRRGAAARAGTVLVTATAVLYGVAFLLVAPGLSLLVLAGYLMAALGPVVLAVAMLAGARRSRPAAVVAGALVLAAVVAWASGFADGEVIGGWAAAFGAGLARTAPRMLPLSFLAAGGAVWIALGWVVLRPTIGAGKAWTSPRSAARWGRVATVIATVCALPYALIRATWLTPWPLGLPQGPGFELPAQMRLQGLLLGGAALAGAVLTTGLIARWGEVWPRWVPGLRGRPVPVAAAVVPAMVVAALLCSAAVPMAMMAIGSGQPEFLLIFPLPVWGPALAAAALAYALRRRGTGGKPGTIEGS